MARILMQTRPNAFTQRGGDTIVLERLTEGLQKRGLSIDLDLSGNAELGNYDLIHLYNFALPEHTQALAQRAYAAGRRYVVTTMYEDWPKFYNQMQLAFQILRHYILAGQRRNEWAELEKVLKNCEPHPHLPNHWTAQHASALFATGVNEVNALKTDYGNQVPALIYHVGCDLSADFDGGELFFKKYGLRDFILCVGRLETRKNQLMLLKALEESEFPLVFATGGFTYQPEYAELCRAFRRKGKTLFVEKLEPQLLSSAYAAAKVHALPSWYELPGIASLEAAHLGANAVVSDYGTARDYFGELAFYVQPDSPEDILNAVTAAFYQPKCSNLAERIASFTWARAASEVAEVYHQILSR